LVKAVGEESVMANENVKLVRRAYQAYGDGRASASCESVSFVR